MSQQSVKDAAEATRGGGVENGQLPVAQFWVEGERFVLSVRTIGMAVKRMKFLWRWNDGTISPNLGIIWEVSVERVIAA